MKDVEAYGLAAAYFVAETCKWFVGRMFTQDTSYYIKETHQSQKEILVLLREISYSQATIAKILDKVLDKID